MISFIISFVLYHDPVEEKQKTTQPTEQSEKAASSIAASSCSEGYAPIKGKCVPLSEVNDPTFAEEILGKGVAIVPAEGKVFSPVQGKVEMVFDTLHAVALTAEDGTEILIHVGLDTVKLNGKHYKACVKSGFGQGW